VVFYDSSHGAVDHLRSGHALPFDSAAATPYSLAA
jgi:hypothetical protein